MQGDCKNRNVRNVQRLNVESDTLLWYIKGGGGVHKVIKNVKQNLPKGTGL